MQSAVARGASFGETRGKRNYRLQDIELEVSSFQFPAFRVAAFGRILRGNWEPETGN
jgi:hypothetical protein